MTPDLNPSVFVAEVVSVQGDTCTVRLGELEYTDVALAIPSDGSSDQVLMTPPVNSFVVVADLDGEKRHLQVLAFQQVQKMQWQQGQLTLEISDGGGFKVEHQGQNLKSVLSDFIDEVCKIIVIYGTTPNVPALQAIKTRLQTILK
jgi:hypothetical protein